MLNKLIWIELIKNLGKHEIDNTMFLQLHPRIRIILYIPQDKLTISFGNYNEIPYELCASDIDKFLYYYKITYGRTQVEFALQCIANITGQHDFITGLINKAEEVCLENKS